MFEGANFVYHIITSGPVNHTHGIPNPIDAGHTSVLYVHVQDDTKLNGKGAWEVEIRGLSMVAILSISRTCSQLTEDM